MKFLFIITIATGIIPTVLGDWASIKDRYRPKGSTVPGNFWFGYCDDKEYPLMLDSLDYEPAILYAGDNFTITAKGKSNTTFVPGTVLEWYIFSSEDRYPNYEDKIDLCEFTDCPTDTLDVRIPRAIGKWLDDTEEPVHADLHIREPPKKGKKGKNGKKGKKGKNGKKGKKGKKGRELLCVRGYMEIEYGSREGDDEED